MKRVAGYVRVSTEKQAEENSHERQRKQVEEWCENNFDVDYRITWYEDIAESGQNLTRDAYERLMRDCKKFDAIVVRELSRFGRNMRQMLKDLDKLEEYDCDFVSVRDEDMDTTSAQGRLIFHIIAAFNQFWSDLASERSEEMIQRRREEGKPIGRPRKLTDEQIEHLHKLKTGEGYSYATLTAIAQSKGWVKSISRQTMANYMNLVEKGEI